MSIKKPPQDVRIGLADAMWQDFKKSCGMQASLIIRRCVNNTSAAPISFKNHFLTPGFFIEKQLGILRIT
jgi:hypothetical protein